MEGAGAGAPKSPSWLPGTRRRECTHAQPLRGGAPPPRCTRRRRDTAPAGGRDERERRHMRLPHADACGWRWRSAPTATQWCAARRGPGWGRTGCSSRQRAPSAAPPAATPLRGAGSTTGADETECGRARRRARRCTPATGRPSWPARGARLARGRSRRAKFEGEAAVPVARQCSVRVSRRGKRVQRQILLAPSACPTVSGGSMRVVGGCARTSGTITVKLSGPKLSPSHTSVPPPPPPSSRSSHVRPTIATCALQ